MMTSYFIEISNNPSTIRSIGNFCVSIPFNWLIINNYVNESPEFIDRFRKMCTTTSVTGQRHSHFFPVGYLASIKNRSLVFIS